MVVESSHLGPTGRDEYWETTQAQLSAVRRRGDVLSLIGLLAIWGVLWFSREQGVRSLVWIVVIAVAALAAIAIPQWFVARGKRAIRAARGLNCTHCGYEPHDTEILEVASTRACSRCECALE